MQLVICGSIFVLLVAVKLLLPARMEEWGATVSGAMERNMDVQAVFSAVGKAFAGEEESAGTAQEVYQAVFHAEEQQEPLKTAEYRQMPASSDAVTGLQQYRPETSETTTGQEETPQAETVSTLAYVLYSKENLPENASLEQSILDFDYCSPIVGTLSSGFGYREHPTEGEDRFHYGIDLAADTGTKICAFSDGTVTAVGESSSYGKYCTVSHPGGYSTLYAHCSRITVSSGAAVRGGAPIAEVGESGMATGPHLHFELQQNGTYLNPIYYVKTA